MSNASVASTRSRSKTRIAVTTAALGVIGCFAAAFTFAEDTPTNEPVAVTQGEMATG